MSRWFKFWRDSLRRQRCAYLVVSVVVVLLAGYLLLGPKPWVSGLAAQMESGAKVRPKHFVITGVWWGALIGLALAVNVVLAGPLLFRRLPENMRSPCRIEGGRRARLALLLGLSLAAILSGFLQAPRLSSSLWGDEEYTAKRFVAGYYYRDAEGDLTLRMPQWEDTAWDFRRGPTNHQLFSVLSRVSHSFHEPSDDPEAVYFSETLIRLPSYLASLGTIFAVGWLVALLGAPRAAILSGFLLAMHPWFIRYGPEARGYALMMLTVPLCLVALLKAASGGRWRHWLAFGGLEFLCFFSYIGSMHFIIMLNLSALLLVLFGQPSSAARWPQFSRFVVANVMAAVLVVFQVLPIIQPLYDWQSHTAATHAYGDAPGMRWVCDVLANLATGLPWHSWDVTNPLALHLSTLSPALTVPFLTLAAAMAVVGAIRLFRHSRIARLLLPALLLPAPLMFLHARLMGSFLFGWYLLVALPVAVGLMALGIDGTAKLGKSPRQQLVVGVATASVFFCLLIAVSHERISLLRSRPVEPLYESVALTRTIINPTDPALEQDVITVGFCMWTEAYDPAALQVANADELRAVLERARSENKPLYLNFGQYLLAKQGVPDIMAMVEDEAQFEQVAVLHGLWQPCTRWIYRAKLN